MYQTCMFCKEHLGVNEVIETLPVGRRLGVTRRHFGRMRWRFEPEGGAAVVHGPRPPRRRSGLSGASGRRGRDFTIRSRNVYWQILERAAGHVAREAR